MQNRPRLRSHWIRTTLVLGLLMLGLLGGALRPLQVPLAPSVAQLQIPLVELAGIPPADQVRVQPPEKAPPPPDGAPEGAPMALSDPPLRRLARALHLAAPRAPPIVPRAPASAHPTRAPPFDMI